MDRSETVSGARKHEKTAARFEARLPAPVRNAMHWLRRPSGRWVRLPTGVLLVAGGTMGFLPVLGFWMLPLGLFLLAEDVPPLRYGVRWMIVNGELRWRRWKRRLHS